MLACPDIKLKAVAEITIEDTEFRLEIVSTKHDEFFVAEKYGETVLDDIKEPNFMI